MKNKVYKILFMLLIMLSAFNVRSEVITGVSDPFLFGDAFAAPLSGYAFALAAGLIGIYILWRYFIKRDAEA